jgi:hypothetical protein
MQIIHSESEATNFTQVCLCLSLVLFLTGCTSAPTWVENPKTAYPENRYLVAVGEGDTRRAAENTAAANLSRIFEARIDSDERLLDQTSENGKDFERSTDFTADISILSSQTLHNVQHAEAWKDGTGRYHAVAYLDRRETAGIYRDRIAEQAGHVRFLTAQAAQTADPLKKYILLRSAARHAVESDRLLQQLKVILPTAAAATTPEYSIAQIQRNLAESAKQIRVDIRIVGDDEQYMTACLEELFTRYGFVVGQPSVLDVSGRVAVTDTGQRTQGLVFVRYELAVQITDSSNSLVLATINHKGREGHVSLAEARVRALRTLENNLKDSGNQRLDQYFDTLVNQPTN